MSEKTLPEQKRWYVMRDLSRPRAKVTMYEALGKLGFEVFTPECWILKEKDGKVQRVKEVIFKSMLFVNASMSELEPLLAKYNCLQFRYQYGKTIKDPMTVPDGEMTCFIKAIQSSLSDPIYIPLSDVTPDKCGKEIELVGGDLNGMRGVLMKMRGTTVKRLIVTLPGFFAAGVEVEPEFIRVL